MALFQHNELLRGTAHLNGRLAEPYFTLFSRERDRIAGNLTLALSQDGVQYLGSVIRRLPMFDASRVPGFESTKRADAWVFTGLWNFFAGDESEVVRTNPHMMPTVIRETVAMLGRMDDAQRREFYQLTRPVWQWMAKNQHVFIGLARSAAADFMKMLGGVPDDLLADTGAGPLLTPAAALASTNHIADQRRAEFDVKSRTVTSTLTAVWTEKTWCANGFTKFLKRELPAAPVPTDAGDDMLPAAVVLTGAWVFAARQVTQSPQDAAAFLPGVIQHTWCALENVTRAQRETLIDLMAPVWPWLQQNEGALREHAGAQAQHFDEVMGHVSGFLKAGKPVPKRNGLVHSVLDAG